MSGNKSYLVIGLGQSGRSAITAINKHISDDIKVTDNRYPSQISQADKLLTSLQVPFLTKEEAVDEISNFDIIVKSPGVPLDNPIIERAHQEGKKVIDELELGYQLLKKQQKFPENKIVAVTGTNGKTTTTRLIAELLSNISKTKVHLAGNVGIPFSGMVDEIDDNDLIVLEVSSFQLEAIEEFSPRVSVILNITPDHLDWHGSYSNYKRAKVKIYSKQTKDDYLVLNWDYSNTKNLADDFPGEVYYFSKNQSRPNFKKGAQVNNNHLLITEGAEKSPVVSLSEILLPGEHNLENILGAIAAVKPFDISINKLSTTLRNFTGVEHRLELVAEYYGIKFINDSKGTNIEASMRAINSFDEPIHLILGGKDKGADFEGLAREIVKQKVKNVFLLGETKHKISEALEQQQFSNYELVSDLQKAVSRADQEASSGEVVLLSPACASWDMYDSFEERGEHYKSIVLSLGSE